MGCAATTVCFRVLQAEESELWFIESANGGRLLNKHGRVKFDPTAVFPYCFYRAPLCTFMLYELGQLRMDLQVADPFSAEF